MIAQKMIEIMEDASASGKQPSAWRIGEIALIKLRRQSRHTGDLRIKDGELKFLDLPVEIADVRNALGAELIADARPRRI